MTLKVETPVRSEGAKSASVDPFAFRHGFIIVRMGLAMGLPVSSFVAHESICLFGGEVASGIITNKW